MVNVVSRYRIVVDLAMSFPPETADICARSIVGSGEVAERNIKNILAPSYLALPTAIPRVGTIHSSFNSKRSGEASVYSIRTYSK